jgi:MerR family transcriptional regulator, light-induced transcriptional regulator
VLHGVPRPERLVRTLKTTEAAALLNVNPNTLRAWERRFGFPVPERSCGGHRSYIHAEIETLAHLLREGVSIASAVSMARAGLGDESHQLVGALLAYEPDRADALMESALAIRSAERSVQEVLLPALARVSRVHGSDSAPWAFAVRWSCDWLLRAQRFTRDHRTDTTILIGDTTTDLDPDAPYVRTLELFCALSGARVLALSARAPSSVGRAVRVLQPRVVVIAGEGLDAEAVARWTYPVSRACDSPQIALYRRSVAARAVTGGVRTLPADPGAAQRELVAMCLGQAAVA